MIFVTPFKLLYRAYVTYAATADTIYYCYDERINRITEKKERKDILHIIYRQMNLNYDCAKYIYIHKSLSFHFSRSMEASTAMTITVAMAAASHIHSLLKQAEEHTE